MLANMLTLLTPLVLRHQPFVEGVVSIIPHSVYGPFFGLFSAFGTHKGTERKDSGPISGPAEHVLYSRIVF